MGDVNLEIKLNNIDERVIKIEESGGGSGGDGYITSVSNDFNVVNKKLSLSNDVTTKLSKVDTPDNLSVELAKKIDKPASATNGQVLTYNGTSNEWEAKDSQGGSASDITYDNSTSGLVATNVQSAVDEITEEIAKISGSSGFPNYANPIMDITAGMTWTATEDCWIIGYMGSNSATSGTYIKIDGVTVTGSYSNTSQHQAPISLPVRKGAVIETRGGDVMIYEMKAYATI